MTTRTMVSTELSKKNVSYLVRINQSLGEIKSIHGEILRKRAAGQKVKARIDQTLKEIQTVIERVEATI